MEEVVGSIPTRSTKSLNNLDPIAGRSFFQMNLPTGNASRA
jgi:hypothetical protein